MVFHVPKHPAKKVHVLPEKCRSSFHLKCQLLNAFRVHICYMMCSKSSWSWLAKNNHVALGKVVFSELNSAA